MVRRPSVRRLPFSKILFSKTAWPIKAKFHMEPQWDRGMKVCLRGLCHITKMATTFKNHLLQNRRASDLVAWYVGTRAHHSLFKWWPLGWPILQQGQIWSLMLLYGEKLLESHLMEEIYSKWPEWQKVYVQIKILTPGSCLCLPRDYIHV